MELIKIKTNDKNEQVVSARELYAYIGIDKEDSVISIEEAMQIPLKYTEQSKKAKELIVFFGKKYFKELEHLNCSFLFFLKEYIKVYQLHDFRKTIESFCSKFQLIKNLEKIEYMFGNWYISSSCFTGEQKVLSSVLINAICADSTKLSIIIDNEMYVSSLFLEIITNNGLYEKSKSQLKSFPNITQKTYLMINRIGHIKIGRSKSPEKRRATLESESDYVKLIAVLDSNIEYFLHKEYEHKRLNGEWFNLTKDETLDLILKYNFKQIN